MNLRKLELDVRPELSTKIMFSHDISKLTMKGKHEFIVETRKVKPIQFSIQTSDFEYYKNSFTKFYNDIVGMSKKSKKSEQIFKKNPIKTAHTLFSNAIESLPNELNIINSSESESVLLVKVT
jgi:hypothetical protein